MANTRNEPLHGIGQMIAGATSFGIMGAFVKYACQTLSSFEVVFFRSFLGVIAIWFILKREKIGWVGKNIKILVLRGVVGFIALSLHFYAIAKLGLGTAVILNYTSPIYVVILARIFLREKTGWLTNLMIATSFAGLFLLAGPQFQAKPLAVTIGVLSGFLAAVAYILIRYNEDNESPYVIIFYFMGIATVGSIPLLPFVFRWPTGTEWFVLVGVSVAAFFGQVWLTKAIQSAPVSLVLPFSYLTPVFASIAGVFLFGEELTTSALLGGAIIIVSGVVLYFFREKPPFIPIEE